MILEEAGTHFDPEVVTSFKSIDDAVFDRIMTEIR
jgi:response regulator RpfG family c-di-GMP phosphodiesterase